MDSGELAAKLSDQVDALDGYFARYLPQMQVAVLVPLAILLTAYTLDWLAATFLLLSAPLIPLFMALVGMGAERLNRDQFLALQRLSGQFIDRVRGLTTLRLFGRTEDAAAGITRGADEYRIRSMRVLRVAFLSSAVLEFFASVAIAVVAIYVGFGLLGYIDFGPAPALTLFNGLFVLLLAPEFFQPLRTLAQHYHDRATALGAAEQLAELDTDSPAGNDVGASDRPVAAKPPGTAPGQVVTVDALTVARPGRGPVIRAPKLNASRGERILIEGPSGSGKTSLLEAIAGLLPAQSGHIHRHADSQQAVGWLAAPPHVARASLAENIRLGHPDADDAAVLAAAERAGVMEFAARLTAGLDTPVGERGQTLSGGQAQRLALARAFASPAPLILLDEPTAALDAATERYVLGAIDALAAEGRALIIASHDQVLRTHADHIYRIRDGVLEHSRDA
jgi:ATP-binding cassette subfamily C protein CydD